MAGKPPSVPPSVAAKPALAAPPAPVLSRAQLQALLQQIDPAQSLDPAAERLLQQLGDEFVDSVLDAACRLAQHRGSAVLEPRDVALHLVRCHCGIVNMASGFGARGGVSRCYEIMQDLVHCQRLSTTPLNCLPFREDYMECLHHDREEARHILLVKAQLREEMAARRGKPWKDL